MSAIAAFLTLSTPAVFAQEAPVAPMTPPVAIPPTSAPPTVAQPAPAPQTTAPQTAATPTPQPVIRVPLDIAPEAAPAPKAARAAMPARTARIAPRPRAVEPTPADSAVPPAAAIAAAEGPLIDETPSVTAPPEPVAEAPAAPVAQNAPAGDGFPWEILGGAAALLIAGGAGLGFARRRRAERERWEFGDADPNAEWAPASPALARKEDAQPAHEPAYAAAPSFSAAPHGGMGRHEALAMAGPTPDNPFATLGKRLARARFLDRQERAEYEAALAAPKEPARKPVSAWEIAQRPTPATPAAQEVRRLEPGRVRKELKPGWTRR